jgi:hypothetical protein
LQKLLGNTFIKDDEAVDYSEKCMKENHKCGISRRHRTLTLRKKENRFTDLILEGEESARGKSEIPVAVILSNVSNLYDHFSRRQPTSRFC